MFINHEAFTWFVPEKKNPLFITIKTPERLVVSTALSAVLPQNITIGINADASKMGILEQQDGFHVCKSGQVTAPTLIAKLMEHGVKLPALYEVEQMEGGWLGQLKPQAAPTIKVSKLPRKSKTQAGESILTELMQR